MCKKIVSLVTILMVCFTSGMTAVAEDADDMFSITLEDASPTTLSSGTGQDSPIFYPLDVSTTVQNGVTQIKKVYEVPPDVHPETLVEPDFQENGSIFTKSEIYKKELASKTETRLVSETVTIQSKKDDKAEILKQLQPIIDYSENGYHGQLRLDASTLLIEVDGYQSYSYVVTKTEDFNALDRNDPVYMDKELDGMKLIDVDWSAQREEQVGHSLVPSLYKGEAQYKGIATGSKATGYTSTVTYFGEVTKEIQGNIQYTIVYTGEKLPEPKKPLKPLPIAAGTAAAGGGIFYAVFFFVWRKNAKIYNLQDGQYVLIDKQHIKTNDPVIDLGALKFKSITNAYVITLDKQLSRTLFGRTINIVSGDVTIQHRVQSNGGEYQFEIAI